VFFTFVLFASIPPVIMAFLAPFPQRGHDEAIQGGAGGH
jgi:hypothetical protein